MPADAPRRPPRRRGIDLGTDQDTFTVRAGETLKITTPTMDAGTTLETSNPG